MIRFLYLALSLMLFTPISAQSNYEIYYQSETEETIQLSVVVFDCKQKKANDLACLYAIQALIFDGIQGSKRRFLPYVQDEEGSFRDHAAYYHDLFDNGGAYSHVIASSIMEKGKSNDKRKFYVVNVNINFKSLKESLVNHNVIRRFGV